jgi:glycolate oxidase
MIAEMFASHAAGENDMTIMMPEVDQAVLARRAEIAAALRAIVPGEGVIDKPAEMLTLPSRCHGC